MSLWGKHGAGDLARVLCPDLQAGREPWTWLWAFEILKSTLSGALPKSPQLLVTKVVPLVDT